jgi:single-strand DNA-binding protein
MNKVLLMGRLTKDPETRGEGDKKAAKFTLAVDRKFKKEGSTEADFISCVSFSKSAEFCEKYLKKGTKVVLVGRIQTGSYTNKEGAKVYTTDIVVDEIEFAESKKEEGKAAEPDNDFMSIPESAKDDMPF